MFSAHNIPFTLPQKKLRSIFISSGIFVTNFWIHSNKNSFPLRTVSESVNASFLQTAVSPAHARNHFPTIHPRVSPKASH